MDEHTINQPELVEQCATDLATTQEKLMRITADFENFQRRVDRERIEWAQRAQISLLKGLLPVVDDIDRALIVLGGSTDQSAQAFMMVAKAFAKFLDKQGVQEIDCSGQLDTERHEAIIQVPTADVEPGMVVSVLQKGYTLKGAVIRPAQVSVAVSIENN